jgi:predicted RNA-binding protein
MNFTSVPDEPQYPDPALIASIEHQAEKLGYLVAQVEELFAKRAKEARHIALVQHGLRQAQIERKMRNGEINDEEYAEWCAQVVETTSDLHDEVRTIYTININRLNEMVLARIDAGKRSAGDLDNFLNNVLNNEGEQQ